MDSQSCNFEDVSEQKLVSPAPLTDINEALGRDSFLLTGDHGSLWFEKRSSILLVTFDNLASLSEGYPRLPWMYNRVVQLGYSVLGVQTFKKDWFRNPSNAQQIKDLADCGFFDRFERVVFIGASMGGFGALCFAPLVTGSWVLAFSPQSTLNRSIAPFETRFHRAFRKTNWNDEPFLDSAKEAHKIEKVTIIYDSLDSSDRQHADRLDGPNVQRVPIPCSTHKAIRLIAKSGALNETLREFAEKGRLGKDFRQNMQVRKNIWSWRRELIKELEQREHRQLLAKVCYRFLSEKDYGFAREALKRAGENNEEL